MKTNKSYSKRIKITRNGKLITRKPGRDHFNAKASRSTQLNNKKGVEIVIKNKPLSRYLPDTK